MIIWPPKGLAGSTTSQAVLNDFFNRNPSLAHLPVNLNVRGHPSSVGFHIILGPTIVDRPGDIRSFIMFASKFNAVIGPTRGVDGDGFLNWVSFSRELRTGDPLIVIRTCLLCLLHINNLIAWS